MGLLDEIKSDIKKSGSNKGKIFYVKEGEKRRVRFLQDMEDGIEVVFHDSFSQGVNVPCQERYGRECRYCEMEGLRTRTFYAWTVWDYDAKETKLFMFAVNNCSPLPAIAQLYETYGTLIDRDYVIGVSGKQQNKTYAVIPMDKEVFKKTKAAKPFSEKEMLKIIDKAYPSDDTEDDEEEYETTKKKRATKTKAKTKTKPEPEEEWEEDEESEEIDYTEMTAVELYKLCKSRDIDVAPRKPQKFYITKLEEWDAAQDDWGDSEDDYEDDEEWEDEE